MIRRRSTIALALSAGVLMTLLPAGSASAGFAPRSASGAQRSAGFLGLDDLHLVGNAIQRGNGKILLVGRPHRNVHGAAYTADPIDITSFILTSAFHVTGPCADGLAVVIQGDGPDAIGSVGGTLGYGRETIADPVPGIKHSLAIELDTYQNPGEPSAPALSLQTRGPRQNDSSMEYSLLTRATNPVNDGHRHAIVVVYDAGVLTVLYGGEQLVHELIDLDALLGLDGGPAYIGWTAANGGCASSSVIARFDLTTG